LKKQGGSTGAAALAATALVAAAAELSHSSVAGIRFVPSRYLLLHGLSCMRSAVFAIVGWRQRAGRVNHVPEFVFLVRLVMDTTSMQQDVAIVFTNERYHERF
jgi:hypothetical protein